MYIRVEIHSNVVCMEII